MKKLKSVQINTSLILLVALSPLTAHADVQGMIDNLQSAIFHLIAPIMCIGGIVFSGIKMAMGDESAKRGLFWSCVGTVIAFTAPAILNYLKNNVAG